MASALFRIARLTFSPVGQGWHPRKQRHVLTQRMRATTAAGESDPPSCARSDDRRQRLALVSPAIDDEHVFIQLDKTKEALDKLFKKEPPESPVFIRAPVASGKSTLVNYLVQHFPTKFIEVPLSGRNEEEWRLKIIQVIQAAAPDIEKNNPCLSHALERVADKTLIFDEAHLLFSSPMLCEDLFKHPKAGKRPRMLLVSAASQGEKNGVATVTPAEIDKKMMWRPPMPDKEEREKLAVSLKEASVFICAESVLFFFKLCGGHRGIFMRAMEWTRHRQEQQRKRDEEMIVWDINTSVTDVRDSLAKSATKDAGGWSEGLRGFLVKSRAVKVNGKFNNLENIPVAFTKVLAGGSTKASGLDNQESSPYYRRLPCPRVQ